MFWEFFKKKCFYSQAYNVNSWRFHNKSYILFPLLSRLREEEIHANTRGYNLCFKLPPFRLYWGNIPQHLVWNCIFSINKLRISTEKKCTPDIGCGVGDIKTGCAWESLACLSVSGLNGTVSFLLQPSLQPLTPTTPPTHKRGETISRVGRGNFTNANNLIHALNCFLDTSCSIS